MSYFYCIFHTLLFAWERGGKSTEKQTVERELWGVIKCLIIIIIVLWSSYFLHGDYELAADNSAAPGVCVFVCEFECQDGWDKCVSWFKMPLPFQTVATKDLLLIRLESTWPVRYVCVCVCVCVLMLFCRLDWFSVFAWHSTFSHQTTWDSLPPHTHTHTHTHMCTSR